MSNIATNVLQLHVCCVQTHTIFRLNTKLKDTKQTLN